MPRNPIWLDGIIVCSASMLNGPYNPIVYRFPRVASSVQLQRSATSYYNVDMRMYTLPAVVVLYSVNVVLACYNVKGRSVCCARLVQFAVHTCVRGV